MKIIFFLTVSLILSNFSVDSAAGIPNGVKAYNSYKAAHAAEEAEQVLRYTERGVQKSTAQRKSHAAPWRCKMPEWIMQRNGEFQIWGSTSNVGQECDSRWVNYCSYWRTWL